MGERVIRVGMQAFRGVPRNLQVELPEGASAVLFGENATGKSTVAGTRKSSPARATETTPVGSFNEYGIVSDRQEFQGDRIMNAFVNDLRYAQTTGVAVEVHLVTGEKLLKGVHEVHEDEGFVSLYDPQHLGDDTTTRKVALDVIGSVTVTDVQWGRR